MAGRGGSTAANTRLLAPAFSPTYLAPGLLDLLMQPLPQNVQGEEGVRLRGGAICKEGVRGLRLPAPGPSSEAESQHCLPWWPLMGLQGSPNKPATSSAWMAPDLLRVRTLLC